MKLYFRQPAYIVRDGEEEEDMALWSHRPRGGVEEDYVMPGCNEPLVGRKNVSSTPATCDYVSVVFLLWRAVGYP